MLSKSCQRNLPPPPPPKNTGCNIIPPCYTQNVSLDLTSKKYSAALDLVSTGVGHSTGTACNMASQLCSKLENISLGQCFWCVHEVIFPLSRKLSLRKNSEHSSYIWFWFSTAFSASLALPFFLFFPRNCQYNCVSYISRQERGLAFSWTYHLYLSRKRRDIFIRWNVSSASVTSQRTQYGSVIKSNCGKVRVLGIR